MLTTACKIECKLTVWHLHAEVKAAEVTASWLTVLRVMAEGYVRPQKGWQCEDVLESSQSLSPVSQREGYWSLCLQP